MSETLTSLITGRFKLRTSARQRRILADGRDRLDRAYRKALSAALAHLVTNPEAKRFALHEAARKAVLPLPIPAPQKNSLAIDAAAQASSFRELKKVAHQVPTAPTADAGRPILHFMWGKNAGWMLLRRPADRAVFLYMVASPSESRFAKRVDLDGLCDMRTGEPVSGGSSTGLIFPLEFGRFHERKFLDVGRPQALKVFERDGEWFADIAFRREAPVVPTSAVLALYQSPTVAAALAVIDAQGALIDTGKFVLEPGPLTQEVISETHRISNAIVALAVRHQAAIVLPTRDGVAEWMRHEATGPVPVLSSRVDRIAKQIAYKAALAGLPCAEMHTAGTLARCPWCGQGAVDLDDDDWTCTDCRTKRRLRSERKAHALALKFQWRRSQSAAERKKPMKEDDSGFIEFIRTTAGAGGRKSSGSSCGRAERSA